MKKVCTCGGSFRRITKSHVIHTRIENMRDITVENVKFNQCKICGKTELEHTNEMLLDELKEHFTKKHFNVEAINN